MVDIDGNPWFVAADITQYLYGQTSGVGHVLDRLKDCDKCKVKRVHLGMKPGRDATVIAESGLYDLVMRSDRPEARVFQDWITKEVLPSIRKNGAYVKDQEKVATGEMSAI